MNRTCKPRRVDRVLEVVAAQESASEHLHERCGDAVGTG